MLDVIAAAACERINEFELHLGWKWQLQDAVTQVESSAIQAAHYQYCVRVWPQDDKD